MSVKWKTAAATYPGPCASRSRRSCTAGGLADGQASHNRPQNCFTTQRPKMRTGFASSGVSVFGVTLHELGICRRQSPRRHMAMSNRPMWQSSTLIPSCAASHVYAFGRARLVLCLSARPLTRSHRESSARCACMRQERVRALPGRPMGIAVPGWQLTQAPHPHNQNAHDARSCRSGHTSRPLAIRPLPPHSMHELSLHSSGITRPPEVRAGIGIRAYLAAAPTWIRSTRDPGRGIARAAMPS